MAKIKISGTIVSADYDDEFFAPWIDKGIITPSSRVVAALEAATEPVDLVINSYGKIASVEVQSYACSMAANIVAALAARGIAVTGYTQTQIMFHGCYTVVEGGAQHLEDTADSLRSVNETVIANLEKLGIEGCSTWFAEGREKWFNGQEALEAKLLTSLADGIVEEAPEMKATASRFAALARPGVHDYRGACAALIAENDLTELRAAYKDLSARAVEQHQKLEDAEAKASAAQTATAAVLAELDQLKADIDGKANERLQSKHDKDFAALRSERDAALKDLEAARAESTSLKAGVEKLTADLATVRDQFAAEKLEHERDVKTIREGGIALSLPAQEKDANMTPREKLATLPPSERENFYQAHKAEIDG